MPLHTRFRPACEEAFCPHYDTARQNFASKVQWSSWEIISFDSLIVQWREDSKIVEAIADTISLSEASRNGLHNGIERDDFPTTTSQPTRTKISSNSS